MNLGDHGCGSIGKVSFRRGLLLFKVDMLKGLFQSSTLLVPSMNASAQQARNFFLHCRARPVRPLRTCSSSIRSGPSRCLATDSSTAQAPNVPIPQSLPNDKPYYVTTPIYYVNAEPHVGHLYSLVLADVLKRWHQLKQPDQKATLLTGTDEHGMKVQKAAELAKTAPGVFCTANAQKFKNLANKANISYDRFIRTTDTDHKDAVESFWLLLSHYGYIYHKKHEGWYCVSDETFYPESQIHLIIEPQTGRKIMVSKETGKEVVWTSEDNYHFRLSMFQDKLLKHYEDHPDAIVPKQRMNFIVSEIKSGLKDLSISRPSSRLQWGIRVPHDRSQTIYVWLDALINYITMAGFPVKTLIPHPSDKEKSMWPADCQVIGKDIIRFHCIYWPAFLMAVGMPVTRRFLSHAHWTMNQEKMSKSLGNVVNPFYAIDRFGVDTIRYYMIRDGGYADDSAYENAYIIDRYKNELQAGLGNMMSRILRAKDWDAAACIRQQRERSPNDTAEDDPHSLQTHINRTTPIIQQVDAAMHTANPRLALELIMSLTTDVNKYFQDGKPWQLTKNPTAETKETVSRVVYNSMEYLRIVCILLQPFMPDKMKLALDMLGVDGGARGLSQAAFGAEGVYGVPVGGVKVGEDGRVEDVLFPPLNSAY